MGYDAQGAEVDPFKRLYNMLETRPEFGELALGNKKVTPAYDREMLSICKECIIAGLDERNQVKEIDLMWPLKYCGLYATSAEIEALVLDCLLKRISRESALNAYLLIACRRAMIEDRELVLADSFLEHWSFKNSGIKNYFGSPHQILRDFPVTGYKKLFEKWIPQIIANRTPGPYEAPTTPPPKHDSDNPNYNLNDPHYSIWPALEMIYLLQISASREDNEAGAYWAKALYARWGNTKGWSEIKQQLGWSKSLFPEMGGTEKVTFVPNANAMDEMNASIALVGPSWAKRNMRWLISGGIFIVFAMICIRRKLVRAARGVFEKKG